MNGKLQEIQANSINDSNGSSKIQILKDFEPELSKRVVTLEIKTHERL